MTDSFNMPDTETAPFGKLLIDYETADGGHLVCRYRVYSLKGGAVLLMEEKENVAVFDGVDDGLETNLKTFTTLASALRGLADQLAYVEGDAA